MSSERINGDTNTEPDDRPKAMIGHSASDIYMLNRDASESQRLETQHKLYITSLGYHIKPPALSHLTSRAPHQGPIRIADIGTGTGAWLQSLAPSLPDDAQLHGYDISNTQFPASASLARNITLSVLDMKAPIPSELRHSYDVVHLRLLLYALERDEWATTLANVLQLAKPGAHVQWEEVDVTPTMALRGVAGARIDTIQRGFDALFALSRARCEFAARDLLHAFHACGLRDVDRDVVSSDRDPSLRRVATEMLPVLLEGLHGQLYGKESEEARKARVLAQEVRREADAGGYINFSIHSVSGTCP